jgi:hypothetical protein
MKRESIGLIGVVIAVVLIIIAASSNSIKPAASPSSSSPPSPAASIKPLPSPSPSLMPEITYTVKTDYSQLKPYQPMEEIFTRLSEDFMPELVPSAEYGELMPYVGDVLYSYYWPIDESYGLVTKDWMIVTDAVYDYVSRYGSLYVLSKELDIGGEDLDTYYMQPRSYTLCAIDGSWTTGDQYIDYNTLDKVLLLYRDIETTDIDVYDYDGNFLYNTSDLSCYHELSPSSLYSHYDYLSYGDGYVTVTLESGKVAFIEELTGRTVYTDFTDARQFNEGCCAVELNGLWGYIDKSFSIVIEPAYTYAALFDGGRAVVGLQSGSDALIDRGNSIIVTAGEISDCGDYIRADDVIYDAYFNKIPVPSDLDRSTYLGDGCFLFSNYTDKTMIYQNGSFYDFPVPADVADINENIIILNNDAFSENGMRYYGISYVYTLDGQLLIPRMANTEIIFVEDARSELLYLVINDYSNGTYQLLDPDFNVVLADVGNIYRIGGDEHAYFIANNGTGGTYRVFDSSLKELFSGEGEISFYKSQNLFEILDDSSFAYMDTSGKYVFRISLLDCIPD